MMMIAVLHARDWDSPAESSSYRCTNHEPCEELDELFSVVFAQAIGNPGTVVVEVRYTQSARVAVSCQRSTVAPTHLAA